MKVHRPARPMAAPIIRYRPAEDDAPQLRLKPCPGCDLLALYQLPGERFSSCAGCGLVVNDEDYLALYGPDSDVTIIERLAAHPPVVYYMRLDAIVKIGFTTRIGRRLLDINPQGVL